MYSLTSIGVDFSPYLIKNNMSWFLPCYR